MAYSEATEVADPEEAARVRADMYRRSAEPAAYFNELRAHGPLAMNGFQGAVEVLNREDIEWVLRHPELFSNAIPIMGSAEPVIPVGVDAPLHTEYRRLLDPALSPRRMAALQPSVAEHTHQLIDTFIASGAIDFSDAIAVPLPCLTFLDLLGVPRSELDQLLYWKNVMIHAHKLAGSMEAGQKLAAETAPKIYEYLYGVIAERRTSGTQGEDLISRLINTEVDGGRTLSDNEIARCLFQLIAAGLDTVTISLECILHHLATHPADRQMIVDDPDSIDNLIEELLRWESPVQSTAPRLALQDVEVAGQSIKAGTILSPVIAAGNVDPAIEGQDTIDVRRGDKRHLAFGGGSHRCLGSHLARMELRTVVREWHKRIPVYGLKDGYEVEWNASPLRGIDHLELQWDPATTIAHTASEATA